MAESMKDYEKELEESMKTIEEGDILTGTVISVDEKEVILDLKYYAEGVIPAENYSREPGFSLKDEVHEGDEVSATVVRKDDGQGNILLSRVEAVDVLAWDKLKELKESGEVLDVVVKGITNAGNNLETLRFHGVKRLPTAKMFTNVWDLLLSLRSVRWYLRILIILSKTVVMRSSM